MYLPKQSKSKISSAPDIQRVWSTIANKRPLPATANSHFLSAWPMLLVIRELKGSGVHQQDNNMAVPTGSPLVAMVVMNIMRRHDAVQCFLLPPAVKS